MGEHAIRERDNQVSGITEKLPRGYSLAWSTRGVSVSVNFIILGYLTFYLTDVVGMGAGLVGALLLASKIFDGVTDLIVGFIIDRTKTRFGKARPYEIMIIPLWISTVLLFSVPNMGLVGQAIYVFIMFSLVNSVFTTFLNGAEATYLRRSVSSEVNRSKMLAITGLVIMVVSVAVSVLFPQLMTKWGTTSFGWTKIALLFAVPLTFIGLVRFFVVKEKMEDPVKIEKYGVKESLLALKQNKYIFVFALSYFLVMAVNGLSVNITSYYFQYIVGDLGLMSIFNMTAVVVPFLILFFPSLIKKFGSIKVAKFALILGIVGSIIKLFAGSNMVVLVLGNLLVGIGTMPMSMLVHIYVIDCMDYGEWKTGKRIEGITNSVNNFASKIANGLAVGSLGVMLGAVGYVGSLDVQPEAVNNVIIGLFSWIPAILFAIALMILHFYDLDEKMDQIKVDLKARRS